jgi:multidrug resistance protein
VNQSRSTRRALPLAVFIIFLDMLGASILIPVIPYIVREYRPDALTVGLLALAYSAAQFLSTPVLGALSDRVGRRPVLLACIFGSACCYFLFGLANTLALLVVSRIIDGLTGGNISTAQATIADLSRAEERSKVMGMIGAAFGLGFVLGPALGGVLSHISLRLPAYVAGCVSLTTFATALLFLPESLPREKRHQRPFGLAQMNPFGHLAGPLTRHVLRWLLPGQFMLSFAMSGMQSNFVVYTHARFGYTPSQNAWVFVWLGLLSVIVQGGLVRRVLKHGRESRLASEALLLSVCGYALVAWCPQAWVLYVAMGVLAFGFGLAGPALNAFLSHQGEATGQGVLMGAAASLSSLARIVGPVFAGAVFDHISPRAPYWAAALAMAVSIVLIRTAAREARMRAAAA